MGMELAQHFTNDLGAFAGGAVEIQPHLAHSKQDPPVDRLEAIADVGQRTTDDYAHGVIEVRALHLVFDVDRNQVLSVSKRWWDGWFLIIVIVRQASILSRP